MKNKIKIFAGAISISALSLPALISLAAPSDFKSFVEGTIVDGILAPIVVLLVGAAVVIFIYGIILKIFSEGGEKAEEGKQYMFWGIIGLFVMISMWGLVNILQGTFRLDNKPQTIQIVPVKINF